MNQEKIGQFIQQSRDAGVNDTEIFSFLNQRGLLGDTGISQTPQVAQETEEQTGFQRVAQRTGEIASQIARPFTGIARGAGEAIASPSMAQNVEEVREQAVQIQNNLIDTIRQRREEGADTTRLETALQQIQQTYQFLEGGAEIDTENREIIGSALNLLSLAVPFGKIGSTAQSGQLVRGADLAGTQFNLAGRVGAGAGSGLMADVGFNLANTEDDRPIRPGLGTVVGGALPGLGAVARTGRNFVSNVFNPTLNNEVIDAAIRRGVEMPASAQTKTLIADFMESISLKGFWGETMRKRIERGVNQIQDVADSAIKKAGGTTDGTQAGRSILDGVQQVTDNFIETKNRLYQPINEVADQVIVSPQNLRATLDDILTSRESALLQSGDTNIFRRIRENLGDQSELTWQQMQRTKEEVGRLMKAKSDPVFQRNQAEINRLYASLADDLDTAARNFDPQLGELLDQANRFYADNITVLNGKLMSKIKSFENDPSKVLDTVLSSGMSAEEVGRVINALPEQTAIDIQTATLARIFEGATSKRTGRFTPSGLQSQLKKLGDEKVRTILNEEQIALLGDMDTLIKALEKPASIASGSQTGFIQRHLLTIGSLFINPAVGIKIAGLDFALSKFIASDAGQKFLIGQYNLTPNFLKSLGATADKALSQTKLKQFFGAIMDTTIPERITTQSASRVTD